MFAKLPNWKRKANRNTDEEKARTSAWLWEAHFDICRVPSLFTLEINRWKVKENKWEERWERGRAQTAICHAERHIYQRRFSKPHFSGSSYLAHSGQLWQENTLGLIWFVLVVLEMLQLWETGGWWSSRVDSFSFSASHPVLLFSCLFALSLPVLLSSLLPYHRLSCPVLSFAGIKLHCVFHEWIRDINTKRLIPKCYTCNWSDKKRVIFKSNCHESLTQILTQNILNFHLEGNSYFSYLLC